MFQLRYNDYDKHVYETELRDFLPKKIIDCHTHIWKKDFTPHGSDNGGATWTGFVADEYFGVDLKKTMEVFFPQNEVTPLVFGGIMHALDETNDYVVKEAEEFNYPSLFRTEYSMTPDFLEEQVKKGGFYGLKPYISNCPPYIPISEIRIFDYIPEAQWEVADKNGWIVILHLPRSKRLSDPVNLGQLLEIEKRYKNVKLVVAHVGRAYSKQDLGTAFDLLRHTENMYFDFSANLYDGAIKECLEAVGSKRVLFGSDLPISSMRMYRVTDETGFYQNVVPRGMYGDVSNDPHMRESDEDTITLMIYEQLRAFKRAATELKLTDSQIEDIMYGNCKRLLDNVAR